MVPYNTYEIGQTVVLEGKSTNASGQPALPVSPRILLRPPNGEETTLDVELSEDVTGLWFHELYLAGPPGLYRYRLVTANDAEEKSFYVKATDFTEPLAPALP